MANLSRQAQQSFLLNEAIKTHPNPALLEFLAGGRPVVWVDENVARTAPG